MNIVEKNPQCFLFTLITIFLSLVLIACSPENKSNLVADNASPKIAQCIVDQSQCEFQLIDAQAQVLFDVDKIVAEQPFNMVIKYQGKDRLKSITGYLEGVDMYMGKIPLFFEPQLSTNDIADKATESSTSAISKSAQLPEKIKQNSKQAFQTEVLVGSCSAAQMKWRIWLTFITEENKKQTKMFTVQSYRI
ncbi:hypothetical protein [Colwellia sp. Arc7-D]|jgi:hypothetical protein|uniref:hypothetical protein n=1 Tax=Colwellia sp. Arc7-D TaxID=2161872 RepID=UPI000D3A65AD|nr:hypothetical protein [Colwellia sp. Arc7-D]AWB57178.1 hypothetical protein DBO93_06190 [Colwellia sp. Arc7-D]